MFWRVRGKAMQIIKRIQAWIIKSKGACTLALVKSSNFANNSIGYVICKKKKI